MGLIPGRFATTCQAGDLVWQPDDRDGSAAVPSLFQSLPPSVKYVAPPTRHEVCEMVVLRGEPAGLERQGSG